MINRWENMSSVLYELHEKVVRLLSYENIILVIRRLTVRLDYTMFIKIFFKFLLSFSTVFCHYSGENDV